MRMNFVSLVGRNVSTISGFGQSKMARLAHIAMRFVVIGSVGLMASGCAMTQLGSMFGSSKEELTTSSISSGIVPAERSLAMAANEMAPVTSAGAVGACPRISIWKNDAQLTIYEIGRVGDNMAIKHRGEITKTARECEIAPGQVTIKYGVAGRVLLGPLGKSGSVTLPVLVHVTDRSSEKIQTSKLNVTVNIADGKPHGNFSTVQTLSFPIEPGIPASQYSVFVTFDRNAPGAG